MSYIKNDLNYLKQEILKNINHSNYICGCAEIEIYEGASSQNDSILCTTYNPNNVIFNKSPDNKGIDGKGAEFCKVVNKSIVLNECNTIYVEVRVKDVDMDLDFPICSDEVILCGHGSGNLSIKRPGEPINVPIGAKLCGNIPLCLTKIIVCKNNDTCHCNLDKLILLYQGTIDDSITLLHNCDPKNTSSIDLCYSFMGKEINDKCACRICKKINPRLSQVNVNH